MFSRFGSRVTILERGERVLSGYEPEISESIAEVLREEGITLHTKTKVNAVTGDDKQVAVTAQVAGRQRELKAAKLLVATGRKPNTESLSLGVAGIELDDRGFVKVNDELRTSVEHVYAAGDVIDSHTGGQMATPVGSQDGGIAADNALNASHEK